MSILFDTSTVAAPTTDDIAAAQTALATLIGQLSKQEIKMLSTVQKRGIANIWSHPILTPQQACDALDVHALELFQAHGNLTDTIVQICKRAGVNPLDYISLPTKAFAPELDANNVPTGRIIVSDQPYIPSL